MRMAPSRCVKWAGASIYVHPLAAFPRFWITRNPIVLSYIQHRFKGSRLRRPVSCSRSHDTVQVPLADLKPAERICKNQPDMQTSAREPYDFYLRSGTCTSRVQGISKNERPLNGKFDIAMACWVSSESFRQAL